MYQTAHTAGHWVPDLFSMLYKFSLKTHCVLKTALVVSKRRNKFLFGISTDLNRSFINNYTVCKYFYII